MEHNARAGYNRRRFVVAGAFAAGAVWSAPTVWSLRLLGGAGSNAPVPPQTTGTPPTDSVPPSSDPTSTTTTTCPPKDALITGGGFVGDKHFGFNARTNKKGPSGELNYTFKSGIGPTTKIHSDDITNVTSDGTRATFSGTATVNRTGGYTFRVDVVDGEPDQFAIAVQAADGSVFEQLGTPEAPLALDGGSIQVR
jgi:hypothetical protein